MAAGIPMVKLHGLSVYLNCSNVEKSRAFYEGLGFKRTMDFPEMGVVGYGMGREGTLLVGPAESDDAETRRWLAARPWGVGAVVMPTVADVDEVHELAQGIGAEIEEPPTRQPWGSRTCRIVDPDGYVLIFDEPQRAPGRRPRRRAAKTAKAAKKASRRAPSAKKGTAKKKSPKAPRKSPQAKSKRAGKGGRQRTRGG